MRLDIALVFVVLAAVVLIQGAAGVLGITSRWIGVIGAGLLLAQPYLLLRLVEHFRAVPRAVTVVAVGGMLGSWVLVVTQLPRLSPPATLAVIAYFVYVEGYAAIAFVRGARETSGVTHWRLLLAALGSGLIALAILVAVVDLLAPGAVAVRAVVTQLLAIAAALSYYVGFAPPGWLRRTWQLSVLHQFLRDILGLAMLKQANAAVEHLCPAARHVTGGVGALAALWDPDQQQLVVRAASGFPTTPERLAATDGAIGHAWKQREPAFARADGLGQEDRLLTGAVDASVVLAVPIATPEASLGILAVCLRHGTLFASDDLSVLALLAEQSALALHRASLFADQQRLLERLTRTNAELERASRLKSEFLANMSHELRTPLNAIIGFSELLLDEPPEGYDRDSRLTFLTNIHESGQHLLALINDILDLSKVEAGKMELRLEAFSVPEAIAQVIRNVETLAARKQIRLTVQTDQAGTVIADEGKVKQILYNLLSNAIKFTPDGGLVTVVAESPADTLHLAVSDTGIGIAPEDQDRIFQEFQQLDAGPGRHYEGTGLGLALTRRFAELHGGRVSVESAPGAGSCFHVWLPRRPTSAADAVRSGQQVAPETPPSAVPRPLVLVVEDDPRAAQLLSIYLTRGGYRTEVVADGSKVIAKVVELQPTAITLDILLPNLDGWDVLRALKVDERTRDIPVVVISVVGNEELGYALGAVDYFVKPVDRQALLARLARYTFTTKVKQREVRVLVVDDDPMAIDLLEQILVPAGFKVLRALRGDDGIALARQQHPDLILLDLMMPEVSGFEVISVLKAEAATRDIPILVITAKELSDEDKQALNGHVAAVLQKGSLAGVDLLTWLDDVLARLGVARGETDDR